MPKPFKPTRPFRLPPDAEIIERDGKPHVRLKDRGRTVLYPLTKDGTKYLRPAKSWYFDLRDANGKVRRVKGFADLKATEQLAAEMERKASRVRSGYTDPAEEHARRPLADHLNDYAAALEAKGNCEEHNRATVAKVSAILSGCGFVFPSDLDAGKVTGWIAELRRAGRVAELPPGDAFSSSKAAELLGVTWTRFVGSWRGTGCRQSGTARPAVCRVRRFRPLRNGRRRGPGRPLRTATPSRFAGSLAGLCD
jgi:hypothetical protein